MPITIEDENGRPAFTPKRAAELASAKRQTRYVLANTTDDSTFIEQVAQYFGQKQGRDVTYLSRQLHGLLYRG